MVQEVGNGRRLDPLDLHLGAVVEAGVAQRLDHRQIGVGQVDVLADDADADGPDGGVDLADQTLPVGEVDGVGGLVELEQPEDVAVEPLLVEDERDLVDVVGVDRRHHRLDGHVAQQRDLALEVVGDHPVRAAHDDVGLDAPAAQLGDRVLGGLGLLLAGRAEVGNQGQVDVADVVPADIAAELADGLDERDDLDVADGAADLDDDHVDVLGAEGADALLDLVGDVGDDLDGLAQVVAPALLGDDRRVDPAGGGVGALVEVLVDEPLVVAEVEVGLTAVLGDEDLAVLERVHGARVDVDVRVELAHGHPEAAALEQPAQRGGGEALAQRRRHPTGEEDVLGGPCPTPPAPMPVAVRRSPCSESPDAREAGLGRSVCPPRVRGGPSMSGT